MKPLFANAAAERARLAAQYPGAFRAPLRQRLLTAIILASLLALYVFGLSRMDITFDRLGLGIRQLGWFLLLMAPPSPGDALLLYLRSLAETVAIAFLGTLLGAALAFPFGLLAAKNVIPNWIFHFSLRRGLDCVRSVDTLIWALIWVNVVGLGPFAGVLAIASSDFGAFGKIFSELMEATERKAAEGIRSAGGNGWHEVRFGLMPQVLPVMAGQVLYFIESNTRSATVIGLVGAGGIGLHLFEQIRTLEWQHVAFIVLMVLAAVAIIDAMSARLRFAMMGRSQVH